MRHTYSEENKHILDSLSANDLQEMNELDDILLIPAIPRGSSKEIVQARRLIDDLESCISSREYKKIYTLFRVALHEHNLHALIALFRSSYRIRDKLFRYEEYLFLACNIIAKHHPTCTGCLNDLKKRK